MNVFKFPTQHRLSATNARLKLLSNVVMSAKTLLLFMKENARKINSLFKFALRNFFLRNALQIHFETLTFYWNFFKVALKSTVKIQKSRMWCGGAQETQFLKSPRFFRS